MRSTGLGHRVVRVAALLGLLATVAVAPARAWDVDGGARSLDLERFHESFSLGAYPYPRHSAKPLGTLGFDIWADVSGTPDFDSDAGPALDGDVPGGYLAIYRVGARKGLPFGIDLGASWGKVVDTDVDLLSGEVSWAILDGGVATPALGLRGTYSRSSGSDVYSLEQAGLEAEISKGFAVLTPYAGAGFVWSQGTFERTGPTGASAGSSTYDSTRAIVYGGVIVNLLVPKIAFEVEKGDTVQGAIRVSFGL